MLCVIPLLLLAGTALAYPTADKPYYNLDDAEYHFSNFIEKYGKQYSGEEKSRRFDIFKDNLDRINKLNEIHDAVYGVTVFSDLSYEEFASRQRFGLEKATRRSSNATQKVPEKWIRDAPDSLDYNAMGLVTPARAQGTCGSCYVFSGVGSIEAQHAKVHKELLVLSVQNALDCDTLDNGCNGGNNLVNVINEVARLGGIELEKDYPYEEEVHECRADKSKYVVKVKKGIEIDTPDEEKLKGALAQYGPLTVVLNWFGLHSDYRGGVITPEYCDPTDLNHGVLLVGYGKDDKTGKDYWIAKNSWGADWGMDGFFWLERGKGYCGIGSDFTAVAVVE